jgi:lysyl-tRNA synthetase, class II
VSADRPRLPHYRLLPSSSAVPKIIGSATAMIGLLDVVSAVFPAFRNGRMHELAAVFPGTVSSLAAATSVVTGILLLMLAHALKRGKQRAWWATVLLLPVGAATQLIYRHSVIGAVFSLALLALLIRHRGEFTALSDPRTRWRALVNFVALGASAFALGLVITSAHPASERGNPGFGDRCLHVVYGLFGFEGPVQYSSDRVGDVVAYSLGGLGLLIACSTVYLVLRPARPVAELSEDEEERLRCLLARHGARDSLGHFALRRDKSVVFSPSGKAAVC